uniref:Uncharacterized protein n=1 Tax=Setaria viridis TaxID=4556 RepID=A0A4U6VU95_SETVI|nr:hypothetical protein SEVIR_2G172350v2 [Setaria viridis]
MEAAAAHNGMAAAPSLFSTAAPSGTGDLIWSDRACREILAVSHGETPTRSAHGRH